MICNLWYVLISFQVAALIEERVRQDEEKLAALDKEYEQRIEFRSKRNVSSDGITRECDENVDEGDGLDETGHKKENSDDEQERAEMQNEEESI